MSIQVKLFFIKNCAYVIIWCSQTILFNLQIHLQLLTRSSSPSFIPIILGTNIDTAGFFFSWFVYLECAYCHQESFINLYNHKIHGPYTFCLLIRKSQFFLPQYPVIRQINNKQTQISQIIIQMLYTINKSIHTVKPVCVITSIKQSPVLKGHIFLILSQKISYEFNLY